MTETALTVREETSLADTMRLGEMLAKSGFFDDTKSAAQAVIKILAGRELGLGPIASMTGINVIKSKVSLGANLMAALVKSDPRYDYRVAEMTATRCELIFYERGKETGRSTFTIEEARAAGVGSAKPPGKPATMLTMYPRNMLFARAMSNGVRWHCPDAFGGSPVYTPDELGVSVDGSGDIIDVTPTQAGNGNGDNFDIENPQLIDKADLCQKAVEHLGYADRTAFWTAYKAAFPQGDPALDDAWFLLKDRQTNKEPDKGPAAPPKANGKRPYSAEAVREAIQDRIKNDDGTPITDAQIGLVAGKLEECFAGDKGAELKRHSVTIWLLGKESTKDLTKAEASAILDWILASRDADDGGYYALHASASAEAAAIVKTSLVAEGQLEIPF